METANFLHADDTHEAGRKLVLGHDEGAKGEIRAEGGHGPDEVEDSRTGDVVYADSVRECDTSGDVGEGSRYVGLRVDAEGPQRRVDGQAGGCGLVPLRTMLFGRWGRFPPARSLVKVVFPR